MISRKNFDCAMFLWEVSFKKFSKPTFPGKFLEIFITIKLLTYNIRLYPSAFLLYIESMPYVSDQKDGTCIQASINPLEYLYNTRSVLSLLPDALSVLSCKVAATVQVLQAIHDPILKLLSHKNVSDDVDLCVLGCYLLFIGCFHQQFVHTCTPCMHQQLKPRALCI